MLTAIIHLLAVILILIGPHLPFMKAMEARRQQALEANGRRSSSGERENRQFVFVQPRVDTPARKPPPRADLSDIDRQARTTARVPEADQSAAVRPRQHDRAHRGGPALRGRASHRAAAARAGAAAA